VLAAASSVPVIVFWIVVAGGVGLSVWVISRVIRAHPLDGLTRIVFEDLSAGRDERRDRNRILAQSVINRLQNPQPLATFDLQMDVMPGANEPGFGGLQPELRMTAIRTDDGGSEYYDPTDRPIKLGAIEFSLRDLLTVISRLFARPPEQHLEGWLIEANGCVDVGAQLLDHRRQPIAKRRSADESGSEAAPMQPLAWLVRSTGGREYAIADLVAQIMVDTDRSTLTSDWRSLRSFQEAMVLRDDQRFDAHLETSASANPKATISAARNHLARSVSYDPSNWIARFSLAVTLCRDNEPRLALQHLDILEQAVTRAWPFVRKSAAASRDPVTANADLDGPVIVEAADDTGDVPDAFEGPGFKELVRHLESLPECAFLILFNQGIALAAQKDDIGSLRRARVVFEQLSDWMPPPPCVTRVVRAVTFPAPYEAIATHVSDHRRTTLALYAMGAHASLIADSDENTLGPRLDPDPESALQRLLERIDADCRVQHAAHWPSAMSARAITHAALGQVLFNTRRLDDAQRHFEAALAAEPRLMRALLGLAEIYVKRADSESRVPTCDHARVTDWLSRADNLLARALAINADCAQGRRLREQVHASPFFVGRESGSVGV
jgi:thioredoxin-like negative regulator of GroEL